MTVATFKKDNKEARQSSPLHTTRTLPTTNLTPAHPQHNQGSRPTSRPLEPRQETHKMAHAKSRSTSKGSSIPPLPPSRKKEPKPNVPTPVKPEPETAQHFLQGIQLETCHDLLSIPDPPSPSSCSKPSRRRLSTPAQPFRDRSNEAGLQEASDKRMTKRSRKSLCHIPSPAETTVSPAPSKQEITVNHSEPVDKSDESPSKRQKKAEGTLASTRPPLPPQPPLQQAHKHQVTTATPKLSATTKSSNITTDTTTTTPAKLPPATPQSYATPCLSTASCEVSLQQIRQLVHSYTLLSDEEKWNSSQVNEITDLTGYVMGPPLTEAMRQEDLANNNVTVTVATHMKAFSIMEPQLKRTEDLRQAEAQLVEDITECKAHKVKGKFRYFHNQTDQQVSANSYEQRYRLMLDEICAIRSEEWACYFADLEQTDKEGSVLASPLPDIQHREQAYHQAKASHSIHPIALSLSPPLSSLKISEHGPVPDSPIQKSLFSPVATSPLLSKEQVLDNDNKPLLAPMADSCNKEQVPSDTISTCSSSSSSSDEEEDDNTKMLLTLPSRDEVNENPDLARAEQKLWCAIDKALVEYSAEVLAIRERLEEESKAM
jgi:hypothetical protein